MSTSLLRPRRTVLEPIQSIERVYFPCAVRQSHVAQRAIGSVFKIVRPMAPFCRIMVNQAKPCLTTAKSQVCNTIVAMGMSSRSRLFYHIQSSAMEASFAVSVSLRDCGCAKHDARHNACRMRLCAPRSCFDILKEGTGSRLQPIFHLQFARLPRRLIAIHIGRTCVLTSLLIHYTTLLHPQPQDWLQSPSTPLIYFNMGLIQTGIKYGALFGIAREGMKAIDRHSSNQTPPQQTHSNQQLYVQPAQRSLVDENGYVHQSWCNGACGGRCNGAVGQNQVHPSGRGIEGQTAAYGNTYGGESPPVYQNQGYQMPTEERRYLTNEKDLRTV